MIIVPREARTEGPSVARLLNQSGRRPERSESRANSSEKYIYIHIYIFLLNTGSLYNAFPGI